MDKLSGQILPLGKAAVALSGGLDSSVLLAICADILGAENCLAVSADTPYMMASEQESADKLCRKIGVKRISVRLSIPDCIKNNPPDRCYLCKRLIFGRLIEEASARGFEKLLDGTNAGDLSDYRPGMRALSELGVFSPFLAAGWGKKEIQECALERGMDVAGKPAQGFGEDQVNFMFPAFLDHLHKSGALFRNGACYSLVGINACHLPCGFHHNHFV